MVPCKSTDKRGLGIVSILNPGLWRLTRRVGELTSGDGMEMMSDTERPEAGRPGGSLSLDFGRGEGILMALGDEGGWSRESDETGDKGAGIVLGDEPSICDLGPVSRSAARASVDNGDDNDSGWSSEVEAPSFGNGIDSAGTVSIEGRPVSTSGSGDSSPGPIAPSSTGTAGKSSAGASPLYAPAASDSLLTDQLSVWPSSPSPSSPSPSPTVSRSSSCLAHGKSSLDHSKLWNASSASA
jgi:hypothetical protein